MIGRRWRRRLLALGTVVILVTVPFLDGGKARAVEPVRLTYDPQTGDLVIDGSQSGAVTSLEIYAPSGLFTGEPTFPVGHIYPTHLFYLTARYTDALPVVNLGPVLTPDLATEFLLGEFCATGYRRPPSGSPVPIEAFELNGMLLPAPVEPCPGAPHIRPEVVLNEPKAIVYYEAATGGLRVEAFQGGAERTPAPMTALEIISQSSRFTGDPAHGLGQSPWDVDADNKLFKLEARGFAAIDFGHVLQPNQSNNEIHADLCVSGAWLGGGVLEAELAYPGAGLVPLRDCAGSPPVIDRDVELKYDPVRGILGIQARPLAGDAAAPARISTVEIRSASGLFVGGLAEQLDGPFDIQSPYVIIKQDVEGFASLQLGTVLFAGMSQEFLASDLSVDITFTDGSRLRNAWVIVPEPTTGAMVLTMLGAMTFRRRRRSAVGA